MCQVRAYGEKGTRAANECVCATRAVGTSRELYASKGVRARVCALGVVCTGAYIEGDLALS